MWCLNSSEILGSGNLLSSGIVQKNDCLMCDIPLARFLSVYRIKVTLDMSYIFNSSYNTVCIELYAAATSSKLLIANYHYC